MLYILHWLSLVILAFGLLFIGRWVKEEAQGYALVGLLMVAVSLITALNIF